jgi:hypothetical protein
LAAHRRRQRVVGAWAAVLIAGLVGVSWLAVLARRGEKQANVSKQEAVVAQEKAVAARDEAVAAQARADQQAKLAEEQKQIALHADQMTKDALQKAEVATGKAKDEATEKEKERWDAVLWAAAADEQLDKGGKGSVQQLRACLASTKRLSDDPPPPVSLDYMVGEWHVDSKLITSTDMDWSADGKCKSIHLYTNGQEIDAKNDVCTWKYKPIAEHEFEVDYLSTLRGPDQQTMVFKIVSPTRMRNTNIGYDAFRIVCPAQELSIRQKELTALQKQADADPGNLKRQADVASGFDKLGVAKAAQSDAAGALAEFNKELTVYTNLEKTEPGNLSWQRNVAQSWGQIGEQQFALSQTANQAGNGPQALQQAAAAVKSAQQSAAIRQQLLHAAPNDVDAQLNAASAFSQLAIALHWDNQSAEATRTLRQTVKLLDDIVDAHRGTPSIRLQLVQNLYYLSLFTDDANEKKDALHKALAIATELSRQNEDTEEMNSWIADLQSALAKLH